MESGAVHWASLPENQIFTYFHCKLTFSLFMDDFMIVINALLCKFSSEMILEVRFISLRWFGGQWTSFHAYRGKLFHSLYSCSLFGNGCNSSFSLGFDPWWSRWVVLMSILCIFSVISKGWILLDALNYIVHHCKQFGNEINRSAAIFMGYLWYGDFAWFILFLSVFNMFYVCHNLFHCF